MAVDNSDQLSAPTSDPRRAYRTEETPLELLAIFEPALEALINDAD